MGDETRVPVNIEEATARLGMDTEFTLRMLDLFLLETPRQIQTLREALAQADYRTCERMAHNLKGAAATLSVESVRECALRLETQSREQCLQDAPVILDALQTAVEELGRHVASLQELAAAPPPA